MVSSGGASGNRCAARAFLRVATRSLLFAFVVTASTAYADDTDSDLANAPLSPGLPPPLNTPYLQYGISFNAEFVSSAGAICTSLDAAHADAPCILGSGGGITARVGRRAASPWYFGGAYEISKQDPNKLWRLATLQQLRFETRYYVTTARDTQPYGALGAGVAGYGNEGGISTYGPVAFAAIGLETQLSRRTVVGVALSYRLVEFARFTDSSGAVRGPEHEGAFAQLFGIELVLEGRDPL